MWKWRNNTDESDLALSPCLPFTLSYAFSHLSLLWSFWTAGLWSGYLNKDTQPWAQCRTKKWAGNGCWITLVVPFGFQSDKPSSNHLKHRRWKQMFFDIVHPPLSQREPRTPASESALQSQLITCFNLGWVETLYVLNLTALTLMCKSQSWWASEDSKISDLKYWEIHFMFL